MLSDVLMANFIALNLFYIWSMFKSDLGIIDIFWGFGFGVIAVNAYFYMTYPNMTHVVLTAMVGAWSARLASYLFVRWLTHEGEDARYTKLRSAWKGPFFLNAYFRVFLIQFVMMFLVALPVYLFYGQIDSQFSLIKDLGVFIFIIGLLIETIADWSLYSFKRKPENKGKRYMGGVYRYSRHPNYFGEVLLWWGLYIYCVEDIPWWGVIGPLLITFLILKFSGIPMQTTDQTYSDDLEVAEYKKRTNLFFPWFPKK
jgi:steroid 5-alpha reductase family enzyme